MLRRNLRRSTALALAAAGAALALAAPAGAATTYVVSGSQTAVDENAGTYKMSGSLVGDWQQTSFTALATSPLFRGKGTELFTGCLDRARDGSCTGDPAGTLSIKFRYVAQYTAAGELLLGACTHPVIGGTGAFAGATGALLMVDTPTPTGVVTRYAGTITLNGKKENSRSHVRAAAARTCGA
jgi:hypothetical protein